MPKVSSATSDFSEYHQNRYIEKNIWLSTSFCNINCKTNCSYFEWLSQIFLFVCQTFYCFWHILIECIIRVHCALWTYKHSFLFSLIISIYSAKFFFENFSSRYLNCCPILLLDFWHAINKLSDKNFHNENVCVCLSNIHVEKCTRLPDVKLCLWDVLGKVYPLENSRILVLQNNVQACPSIHQYLT